MEINEPLCRQSAPNTVLCDLHASMVSLALSNDADLAAKAGYGFVVRPARISGFEIMMSGCVMAHVGRSMRMVLCVHCSQQDCLICAWDKYLFFLQVVFDGANDQLGGDGHECVRPAGHNQAILRGCTSRVH